MFTMAAFLQASAALMLDPDSIPDDEMRQKMEAAKEAMDFKPVHAAALEEFASGDTKYVDGTVKRVQ